jgi:hypothetical protein
MRTSGPRTRQLRPEVWQDPAITRLGPWERLLFLGLISLADDEGRFVASPAAIHAHVFPCDADVKIGLWLEALRKERLIALYKVEGTVFGELRSWRRHQAIKAPRPSKLPPGPFAGQNAICNSEVYTEGVGVQAVVTEADSVSFFPQESGFLSPRKREADVFKPLKANDVNVVKKERSQLTETRHIDETSLPPLAQLTETRHGDEASLQPPTPQSRASVLTSEASVLTNDPGAPGKQELERKAVDEVFGYWRQAFGLNARTKLTPKRRTRILARLREGYGVERMKRAIDGCAASAYHRENHYTDLELILRSGEKLERFEALAATPTPEDQSAARAARAAESLSVAPAPSAPAPQPAPPSAGGWSEADWDVVLTMVEGAWPDPFAPGLRGPEAVVWRKVLGELPPAAVRAALRAMIEAGRKRRPTVGEVLAEARRAPVAEDVPAFEEAWERMQRVAWASVAPRASYASRQEELAAKEEAVMAALSREHPVIAAFAAAAGFAALRAYPTRELRELWDASVRAYLEERARGAEG